MPRQVEADGGADAGRGVDPRLAAGLPGEAVDHGQAQARALPDRLGGEERVERLGDHVRGHAGAGVADAQRDVGSGRQLALLRRPPVQPHLPGLDRQPSAVRHGVARVDAQVEQRVLELVRIDQDGIRIGHADHRHGDGRSHRASDQLLHAGDQPVHVGRLGFQRLPSRERQQPVRQRRRPVGGALRGLDVARRLVMAPLPHPRLQQLQAAGDAGQQVVEVVRQAAGELAHRLHLLALPQRRLGLHQRLGARIHLALQVRRQQAERVLRPPALHRHAGALGDLADQGDLFRRPVAGGGVVEVEQRDQAVLLGQRHVDHCLGADRLERVGMAGGARVGVGVGEHHGLAALQVLDVAAEVAEPQQPGKAADAGRVPVALDADGFRLEVDGAVAGPADLQRPSQDLGRREGQLAGVVQAAEAVVQGEQGLVAPFRPPPVGDVDRGAGQADRGAVGRAQHLGLDLQPHHPAVRTDRAVGDVVVAAGLDAVPHRVLHPGPVLGMHRGAQVVVGERQGGIAAEVLAPDARGAQGLRLQVELPDAEPPGLGGEAEPGLAVGLGTEAVPEQRAVLAVVAQVDLDRGRCAYRRTDLRHRLGVGFRSLQEAAVAAQDLVARVAGEPAERVVGEHHRVVVLARVGDDHRHAGRPHRRHERIRAVVAPAQLGADAEEVGVEPGSLPGLVRLRMSRSGVRRLRVVVVVGHRGGQPELPGA